MKFLDQPAYQWVGGYVDYLARGTAATLSLPLSAGGRRNGCIVSSGRQRDRLQESNSAKESRWSEESGRQ